MAEDAFPTVKVSSTGERTLQVELPPSDGTQVPSIPDELRGQEIPAFVLEWLTEADEMGLIIQELLQAPTQSLCRIYRVPTYETGSQFGTPTSFPQETFSQPSMGPEVSGFSATEAPPQTVPGLPEGVQLPVRLLEIISMTKRLEAWIEKGRRVRAWAEEQGYGDAPWLPTDV